VTVRSWDGDSWEIETVEAFENLDSATWQSEGGYYDQLLNEASFIARLEVLVGCVL